MLYDIQKLLTQKLWDGYLKNVPKLSKIFGDLNPVLDHYAIIDLSSKHSGISHLTKIFELLGFIKRGEGYLPDKQNDFIWLTAHKTIENKPELALPQVVLADFRNDEFTIKTRMIVEKYTKYEENFLNTNVLEPLLKPRCEEIIVDKVARYLNIRPWPQPTLKEYMQVKEENPLLAWVLLFGRKVNHFGIGVYAMEKYNNLEEFNKYISTLPEIHLNHEGGAIKGHPSLGIEQSSTLGESILINFDGKLVEVNDSFMEFVWRHPIKSSPIIMEDYYLDFIPANANKVVESLYI
jgi:hypothetical protein